jgi:hypothetical protein
LPLDRPKNVAGLNQEWNVTVDRKPFSMTIQFSWPD